MKIHLVCDSKQGMGGGFTFMHNLRKGLAKIGVNVVGSIEESDICLISGTSMVTKETVRKIKELNKKLVVRNDNVPRNSRNRNTGTSRLYSYTQQADAVVWQCEWAKWYLEDFLNFKGLQTVIYNGVDTTIFKKDGAYTDFGDRNKTYMYSRFNRDETKNWEVAWYEYQLIHRENPDSQLVLVGKWGVPPSGGTWEQYNFDFFRGENIVNLGIVSSQEKMAMHMRGVKYFLATYFNDCYSNTYLEALACGVELIKTNMSGGTPELLEVGVRDLNVMAQDYKTLFEKLI